ncbi:Sin3 associated polypeptide p18-domain-containing protein [Paecilomyces variotii]|uniref:Sin3 associated polypeptide p18-domain-containing protein n=1 Tax=Byssochlamys spectabilis TaxID=264951 RepID=A0A443HVZ2_BYSSP|nr:Sin3 associated polypeptide p18-domain-containing protein [Paecilomyces variotii]KAJ9270009.1 hypothetical protein DTO212C5_3979 [Paecilomyces variotii]RWQ95998.1 Sin3 associated polypeptide p18-domain-containing protein [Paecilomyces variotii]
MAARDAPKPTIDRQSTTPFHLKLFYRQNAFHHLSDFPITSPPPLPPHLQIYTWQSCTLRELSQLLTSAIPSLLPDPAVGTRLSFRLIYPDTRGAATMGGDVRGRFLSKDIGSVVVAPRGDSEEDAANGHRPSAAGIKLEGDDADKTLQEIRFVIGDYIDCAILPPLEDGSVAPPLTGRGAAPSSALGGGMRAFGPPRENGYGRPRGGGRGGFSDRGNGPGVPSGDWRRGERVPEGSGGRYGGRRSSRQY